MSFGIRLPNSGPFATAAAILEITDAADGLGYDTVWVHDHISWGRDKLTHFAAGSIEACTDQDPNFYESLTTIAFAAGRRPRLNVGVAGLVLPLRDPLVLGKQLATLDSLTGGRVVAAVAIGNIPNDFEVLGVPYKRRARITGDYLGALRAVLAGEPSFEGERISYAGGTFLPMPTGLRVWVAASSEPGLARAVAHGDGWLTVYQPVEGYRTLSDTLSALAEKADRDPSTLRRGYETFVSVADTHAKALANARASMVHSFKDVERGQSVCLIGTPAEFAERVAAYRDAGVEHFELKFYCRSLSHMREQMEALAP
jgi:alkanesulfonate monooxygenase SsuD/methylene tetrahydromethanopterin reductase-like flavin-dependent oxidoreductase (luciferase family)